MSTRPWPTRCIPFTVSRYAPNLGSHSAAVQICQDYALRARLELEMDHPSIQSLQTLMLLSQANFQLGNGKTTYMLLSEQHFHHRASQPAERVMLTALSSFGHQHGFCFGSAPRTTQRQESDSGRTRGPTPTLLVLLPHGPLCCDRFQATLVDCG